MEEPATLTEPDDVEYLLDCALCIRGYGRGIVQGADNFRVSGGRRN